MVARRLFTAIAVAFVFSGLFTWWIGRKLAHASEVKPPPMRRVVSVSRNVAVGETLEPSLLQISAWTGSQPLAGSFDRPDEVTGRVVLVPLAAGEMVLTHDLAASGTGNGLMARVPNGMRALTVRGNEIGGDTSFLLPGSLVDVLATYKPQSATDLVTSTVLQSVHVLAVGTSMEPNPDPKATTATTVPPTVTVLLSPQDAEKLTLAASVGKIVFVLRNGADRERVEGLLTASSPSGEPVASPRGPAPTVVHVKREVPVVTSPGFTVETIAGSKQSEETFGGIQ